jgi:hypothetical protein
MKIKEDEIAGGESGNNAPSMSADAIADNPIPLGMDRKKYKMFKLMPQVWRRFENKRKATTEEWLKELDCSHEQQRAIHEYATKNPNKPIVLCNSKTGELKLIRRKVSK